MATAKEKLAALKAQLTQTNEGGGGSGQSNNYYPFWNMKNGQRAVVRFLEDRDSNNPRDFLVEKLTHKLEINGKKTQVPCLTMYEQECPICKVSQAYYKAKDEINGKRYWRSRQYLAQALIIDDPLPADENGETHAGKVRFLSLGFQIYNIIKEAFASEDDPLEALPYDYEEGYDFIIKRTENGQYPSYANGTKFHSKQRALTEQEVAAADAGRIVLSTLLPANPGYDKVNAQLQAEQNGGTGEEAAASAPAPSAPSAPAAAPVSTSVSAGSEEDVDAMLASIRARRNGSA